MKNRNALNLLFRGFQVNLYENHLLESVSNELTGTPLSDGDFKANVKSKRHDITKAHTYLNKSIISPDLEIYTYFADYPEPVDTPNSTMTTDVAKLISSNETIFNETNDTNLIADVAAFIPSNETIFNDTDDSPFRIDLTELISPSETILNNTNENVDTEFADVDFDKTISDKTFLPSQDRKNDSDSAESFKPLPIPEEIHLNEHRNVKRHKTGPFPYLPPSETTRAPPISNHNFVSNGISVDLQRDGNVGHQLDVRFGSDNKEVTQSSQQQHLSDQNDAATFRQFSQQISTSKNRAQAYYYASIENNRPGSNYDIKPPPLQTYYPASIQNNYASHTMRPLQYRSTPLPASLPSIVYSPNAVKSLPKYVQQSVKIPVPPSLTAASNAQYYSAPYTNRPCDLPSNHPNEKVVVKIVPATGWYLNDEKERKSYFDAVAHGLLNENGFVYVNDVQRYSSQSTENVPRVWYSSSDSPQSPPPSPSYSPPSYYNSNQRWELPQYGSPVPVLQQQQQSQPRQLSSGRPLNAEDGVYRGETSYGVPLQSVGKLAGDNKNETYSLASLRSSSGASTSTDRIFNRQNVR